MEDKVWKSKPFSLRTCKISSWIQSAKEITIGIGLLSNLGLILSIGCKSEGDGVLNWAEYRTL